ncbi:MAG: hypothetical protein E7263_10130 [Lachnospiraceae bacterium]|nr:hypothetical protein [Lachnospiraceae bacterium]
MKDKKEHFPSKLNYFLKISAVLLILVTLEFLALTLVALIPKSSIQTNMEKSASFLCENDVFFYANLSDKSSKIDRYADSILLNVAYNYDDTNPITSIMSSSYYYNAQSNENVNLFNSVKNDLEPNLEYSRYWHGSIIFIRPLLLLFNIEQIYTINSFILALLLIVFLYLLTKHFGKGVPTSFLIATVMMSSWYIPLSLEYTWTILIMLIASIVTVIKLNSNKFDFTILFLIVGNITAYFDFLTTETITLLIPLSLIVTHKYVNKDLNCLSTETKSMFFHGLAWLSGYIFAWISKWTLASIFLHKNVFYGAINQAKFRAIGQSDNLSGLEQRIAAEARNIGNIFPFSLSDNNSFLYTSLFFITAFCVYYIIRKEKCSYAKLIIMFALLPYLRYFVLGNHSYLHHFFTFRAQLTTLFCIGLLFVYGSDRDMLSKEWRKKCKKQKKKK